MLAIAFVIYLAAGVSSPRFLALRSSNVGALARLPVRDLDAVRCRRSWSRGPCNELCATARVETVVLGQTVARARHGDYFLGGGGGSTSWPHSPSTIG